MKNNLKSFEVLRAWIEAEYLRRTKFIEDGGINIDWLNPETRIQVVEMLAKVDELQLNIHPLDLRLWLVEQEDKKHWSWLKRTRRTLNTTAR